MTFEEILNIPPSSLSKDEKEKLLTERLVELTKLHQERCPEYSRILESIDFDVDQVKSYTELPFLPVRMFKEHELKSVADEDIGEERLHDEE